MPALIRNLDDDEATIMMVDSNLQRENLLPSEKARAYRMKLDAVKHQGAHRESTSGQLGQKLEMSSSDIGKQTGDSDRQVRRYIRLTYLIPELMEIVDEKKIAFNPAVELSYLKKDEQEEFLEAMNYGQTAPSLSQAQRIKKLSQQGKCTQDAMNNIMNEGKKQIRIL